MMSNEEYARNAERCPSCGESDLDASDDIQLAAPTGLQPMVCYACGLRYTETWELTGYTVDEDVVDDVQISQEEAFAALLWDEYGMSEETAQEMGRRLLLNVTQNLSTQEFAALKEVLDNGL